MIFIPPSLLVASIAQPADTTTERIGSMHFKSNEAYNSCLSEKQGMTQNWNSPRWGVSCCRQKVSIELRYTLTSPGTIASKNRFCSREE